MQRVSTPMIQNLMLSDMHNNLSRLLEYQHQLATGKKHSRPSDNPIVTVGRGVVEGMAAFGREVVDRAASAVPQHPGR